MKRSVFIIDDDPSLRDSLTILLELSNFEVTAFASGTEFLETKYEPGVILSDVRMPGVTGLELTERLARKKDPRPIILMTGHGDIEMAVKAIKLGAFDFIEKPFAVDRVIESVESALGVSKEELKHSIALEDLRKRYELLSGRQRETMKFLVRGCSNKEIAIFLDISPRTVEVHRGQVMSRMGAKTAADLVRMSMALHIED